MIGGFVSENFYVDMWHNKQTKIYKILNTAERACLCYYFRKSHEMALYLTSLLVFYLSGISILFHALYLPTLHSSIINLFSCVDLILSFRYNLPLPHFIQIFRKSSMYLFISLPYFVVTLLPITQVFTHLFAGDILMCKPWAIC